MKLKINTEALYVALKKTTKVINNKSVIPVLTNLLIKYKNNNAFLTATDLETTIIEKIEGVTEFDDFLLLDPKKLMLFLNKSRSTFVDININYDKNFLIAKLNDEKVKIPISTDIDVFTKISFNENDNKLKVNYNTLLNTLKDLQKLTSNDDLRPAMTGVLLHRENGDDFINVVGTDSHKLGLIAINFEEADSKEFEFIVSKSFINNLPQDFESEHAIIKFNSNEIILFIDNTIVVSKLIKQKYPNYKVVIPKHSDFFEINTEEFLNKLLRGDTISDTPTNLVKIEVFGKKLNIYYDNNDFNISYDSSINLVSNTSDITIGLNSKYAINILSLMKYNDTIKVYYDLPNKPIIFTKDYSNLYLLMPLLLT